MVASVLLCLRLLVLWLGMLLRVLLLILLKLLRHLHLIELRAHQLCLICLLIGYSLLLLLLLVLLDVLLRMRVRLQLGKLLRGKAAVSKVSLLSGDHCLLSLMEQQLLLLWRQAHSTSAHLRCGHHALIHHRSLRNSRVAWAAVAHSRGRISHNRSRMRHRRRSLGHLRCSMPALSSLLASGRGHRMAYDARVSVLQS